MSGCVRSRRSQAAGDFAKSAAVSTSLQMMALHDELVQRMKTVADADSQAADDDDAALPNIVVFEPSAADPDLGRVDVQRVDPDRLPPAPARQPAAATDKKPVAPTAAADVARPAARAPDGRGNGPARRTQAAAAAAAASSRRSQPQLVACVSRYGDKAGELKDPLGVACLPGGEIVVSEWGNRRLQVFDAGGKSLRLIAPGQVDRPSISHLGR